MMKRPKPPTKNQLKSEATRTALLQAAEAIFERDGFERAQIDEIAKKSGRTRVAVYAQYKTKEQLFFALQEHRIESAIHDVEAAISAIDERDFQASACHSQRVLL
jgi:AcrR family transcriptional regulator